MGIEVLLNNINELCRQAGDAIMDVYQRQGSIEIATKSDNSPVTEADLNAHHVLVEGLRSLGSLPILSEESAIPDYKVRASWDRYWLVDPLDGTKEFINGNGEFTVNVALIENNEPVLGVVYAPVLRTCYLGAKELGAWKDVAGERSMITTSSVDQSSFRLVASRRHGAGAVNELIGRLEDRFGQVSTKSMGSSLKLCLVAEGQADLYPRLAPTSEWDTAAAQAVVEAAGGLVLNEALEPLKYNAKDDLLNPYFYVVGDADFEWPSILAK